MSFNRFYEDELALLRETGKDFALANDKLAPFLSDASDDPDVERLLEGVAFLTANVKQKLDDDLPEIATSMLQMLWPDYLRVFPACSTLEFKPKKHCFSAKKSIQKGVQVASLDIEGTACEFMTCSDVDVFPVELTQLEQYERADGTEIQLRFEFEPGIATENVQCDSLKLFLHDAQKNTTSQLLYMWLARYLSAVNLVTETKDEQKQRYTIALEHVSASGFADQDALLPGAEQAFSGFRLLQEYFSFPEKFMYWKVAGLSEALNKTNLAAFSLALRFNQRFPENLTTAHFRLFCTPIVNLFKNDAKPIPLSHERVEYLLRPEFANPEHVDIFSVESVTGNYSKNTSDQDKFATGYRSQSKRGADTGVLLAPYESFSFAGQHTGENSYSYKVRFSHSVLGSEQYPQTDFFLRLVKSVGAVSDDLLSMPHKLSTQLLCTNRELPTRLQPKTISRDLRGKAPQFVTFFNTTAVSAPLPGANKQQLQWQTIANLAMNFRSLSNVDSLRQLITLMNRKALYNRKAQRECESICAGIERVEQQNDVVCIHQGRTVAGLQTTLTMRESQFGTSGIYGEANMYLFASVLNRLFASFAPVNSFHQLVVEALESGETYTWPIVLGNKTQL